MISDEKRSVLRLFAEGKESYNRSDFRTAESRFLQALEIDPEDGPSRVYLERCREFIENPPPQGWDGVYVMKTK